MITVFNIGITPRARNVAVLAMLALGVLLAAGCTTPRGRPVAAPPLRFGLTADYPPFALRTAAGGLTGADVEAARRVARVLGREPVFVPTTWTTLAADFAAGRFDVLVGGITVTSERRALGQYSVTLLLDGKRPLVRCADRGRLATAAQLDRPEVRVMINRGPSMPELARRSFPRATLIVERDDAKLVPSLLAGRVDAWVADGVVVDHMARRHAGVLCAARTGPWPGTEVHKAWLLRRDPVLVAAVDRALRAELRSGRWQRDLRAVR